MSLGTQGESRPHVVRRARDLATAVVLAGGTALVVAALVGAPTSRVRTSPGTPAPAELASGAVRRPGTTAAAGAITVWSRPRPPVAAPHDRLSVLAVLDTAPEGFAARSQGDAEGRARGHALDATLAAADAALVAAPIAASEPQAAPEAPAAPVSPGDTLPPHAAAPAQENRARPRKEPAPTPAAAPDRPTEQAAKGDAASADKADRAAAREARDQANAAAAAARDAERQAEKAEKRAQRQDRDRDGEWDGRRPADDEPKAKKDKEQG